MKKLIAIAALATAAIATPALAGTVTGEVRLGDVRGGKADSTEYRVEAWDSLYGVKVGAELQAKQGANSGAVKGLISAKAGLEGPAIAGVHSLAYAEVGHALTQKVGAAGGNHEFWGLGVKLKRDLIGPVALTAGYRHREAFEGTARLTENRLDAGLALDIGAGNTVGAKYYRTTGTTRADAVGLNVTHSF